MAKTSLKVRASRKPKFKVRGYTRCQRCGRVLGNTNPTINYGAGPLIKSGNHFEKGQRPTE
jgi:hypothetical protein